MYIHIYIYIHTTLNDDNNDSNSAALETQDLTFERRCVG